MKIVLASSEAVPWSKTGGLADVSAALPKALAALGHDVTLILPHYSAVSAARGATPPADCAGPEIDVQVGDTRLTARLLILPAESPAHPTVILVDQPELFDRQGMYVDPETGKDYPDNCRRFVFFSRAVMETCLKLQLDPDVLHVNDWQTGLIPALLQAEYRWKPGFSNTASVITLHNLAFHGSFWHFDMPLTGLDWHYFNYRQMEAWGNLNLLKTGIVFSDHITTVSPTYAAEIQTAEFGCGLHPVLVEHSSRLTGILNGIDPEVWNPETDPALAQNYSVETVHQGKPACRRQLQQKLGLNQTAEVPLFSMISRLTDQKGVDLLCECLDEALKLDMQLAVLGTGDRELEAALVAATRQYSGRVAVVIGYDEELAHQIEAGADIFLMPSRFEPCGLNQMYSQRYGTVPIVRSVGGLADSVVDASPNALEDGTATGLVFSDYSSEALLSQIRRAVRLYHDRERWHQLMDAGMRKDFSWTRSAREYQTVYEKAIAAR
ncbi:MAG: glycogen synthase GlgA [Planctomycetaceae bacterium]|nr:glycogen synthase GlgA [Planctomycetaceae bacterium]